MSYKSINEEEKNLCQDGNDLDEMHHKVNFFWFFLMKSAEIFNSKYGRYPGSLDHENFYSDVPLLRDCVKDYELKINKECLFQSLISELYKSEEYLHEFCRMMNSQLPPAVSIISSIASQEIIKLITYQFKSLDNTLIYDGINSTVSAFKF
jgi:hypothetical protein